MSPPDSGEDDLADRIYEASVLPEFWPDVLRDLATVAEGEDAILIATNGTNFKWVASSEHFASLAAEHYQYAGAHERTRRLMALRRAGFVTDTDVFSPEEIGSDPLFQEFLIPRGLGRGIATAIEVPTGDTLVLHSEGAFHLGPFAPKVIRRLNGLRPHLARSALISARLAFERARTAVDTLAGLGLAACAVSSSGTVIVANAEFEDNAHYWTTRMGGRIALQDQRADLQLADALAAIKLDPGVLSLPLVPQGDEAPAVLHVVPVRRAAHDLFTSASAILVLTKASSAPAHAAPLLQTLFDLSPTEADTAARFAAGQTAEAIALAGAKSIHTVRNQIKSILGKTGCARQADLARMLTQLMPAAGSTVR